MTLVRTYLYAVRNHTSLEVKFGFSTSDDLPAAHRQLRSRYSSYYLDYDLLQLVPVRTPGRKAEAALKARLAAHHVGSEFLKFGDEATLQAALRDAYEDQRCPESEAHRVESCRESKEAREARRSAREEARRAATAASIAGSKRRAETALARQAKMQAVTARRTATKPRVWSEEDLDLEISAWARKSVALCPGAHFLVAEAYRAFCTAKGDTPQRAFGHRLVKLFAASFSAQKKIDGKNTRNVFDGLRLL